MATTEFVKSQLPRVPARVLEVGCGEGRLARALNDLGHRVTAIDPAAPDGAIFLPLSLEEFAAPGTFDAIVASRSLHHITDLGAAPSKLQHLLVQGGRLIVIEHAWERLSGPPSRHATPTWTTSSPVPRAAACTRAVLSSAGRASAGQSGSPWLAE